MATIKVKPVNINITVKHHELKYSPQWCGIIVMLCRVLRVGGLAPVKIRNQRTARGCPVTVFPPFRYYGFMLLAVLHSGILTGLWIDINVDQERSIRTRSRTSCFAFIVELVFIFIITTIGITGASKRWEITIQYLNIVEEINSKLGKGSRKYTSKSCYIATVISLVFTVTIHILDFITFILEAIWGCKEVLVVCLYSCFYMELVILAMLEMQFMWTALFVESTLSSINKSFEDLIHVVDLKGQQTKKTSDVFRQLTLLYGATCDVIIGISDTYGTVLIPFIGSFIVHFVVTPFYLVAQLNSKQMKVGNLILQMVFCFYHFLCMIMVVEPGYLTERQSIRTEILTSRFVRKAVALADVNLTQEIDIFLKQLQLTKAIYTPMNMCTLSRAIVFKIMGAVTTYLVIILQFQQLDINNW